jgi:hypothetical protein
MECAMWVRVLLIWLVATIGAAKAEPLDWLAKDKKIALGELIGGYTEGMICKKQVDFDVAGKFLEQKFGGEKFTPEQVAQIYHMVIGVHAGQIGEFFKTKPSEQSMVAHCKKVYDNLFGPKGNLIPNLLK